MQWRRGRLAKMVGAGCVGALVLFGLVRHFGIDGDIGNAISAARVASQGKQLWQNSISSDSHMLLPTFLLWNFAPIST